MIGIILANPMIDIFDSLIQSNHGMGMQWECYPLVCRWGDAIHKLWGPSRISRGRAGQTRSV